jgi:hypothetical protein
MTSASLSESTHFSAGASSPPWSRSDFEREREERHFAALLRLPHLDVQLTVFVADLRFDDRVPRPAHPLIEKLLERAATHVLERALQVVRLDDAAAVLGEIAVHSLPEEVVPEVPAQHVKDQAALFVQVSIEQIDGFFVVATDDGPYETPRRPAEIADDAASTPGMYSSRPRRSSRSTCPRTSQTLVQPRTSRGTT